MIRINTRFSRFILVVLVVATLCLTVVAFRPAPALAACTKRIRHNMHCWGWCSCATQCSGQKHEVRVRGSPGDYEYQKLSTYWYSDWTCDPYCPPFCN